MHCCSTVRSQDLHMEIGNVPIDEGLMLFDPITCAIFSHAWSTRSSRNIFIILCISTMVSIILIQFGRISKDHRHSATMPDGTGTRCSTATAWVTLSPQRIGSLIGYFSRGLGIFHDSELRGRRASKYYIVSPATSDWLIDSPQTYL